MSSWMEFFIQRVATIFLFLAVFFPLKPFPSYFRTVKRKETRLQEQCVPCCIPGVWDGQSDMWLSVSTKATQAPCWATCRGAKYMNQMHVHQCLSIYVFHLCILSTNLVIFLFLLTNFCVHSFHLIIFAFSILPLLLLSLPHTIIHCINFHTWVYPRVLSILAITHSHTITHSFTLSHPK